MTGLSAQESRGWTGWRHVAAAIVLSVSAAGAQERGPVVSLQPGMMTGDFVSAPEEDPATTGFNLRVIATIPGPWRWLTLYVGANLTPYGTTGASRRNINAPAVFVGNVFPIFGESATRGWLTLDLPVIITYSYGGGGDHNERIYGRDLAVEAVATVPIGPRLLSGFGGPLARLRGYGVLQQSLTPNRAFDGARDRFNPIAFYGLSLPFGTGRASP